MPPQKSAPPPEDERPEPLRVKDIVKHLASEWLLRRMERFQLIRRLETKVQLAVERVPRTHVDPTEWRIGFLSVYDGVQPYQLEKDLREVAPQALLRDLFRPESDYGRAFEHAPPRDIAGIEGMREARAARVRDPIPRLQPAVVTVEQLQESRRRMLREPWRPRTPDHLRKQPGEEDAAARARARMGVT